jgi:uncharacterized protein (TIGR04141 family)
VATVNLYKVYDQVGLIEVLENDFELCKQYGQELSDSKGSKYSISLYYDSRYASKSKNNLGWEWVLKEFNKQSEPVQPRPKAVVLFYYESDLYAATFGYSFFVVDKYAEKDFPFAVAKKIKFKQIKRTTSTAQSSVQNKAIYSYVNCFELIYDSGMAFSKIKADAELDEGFSVFKKSLQFGNSIRFSTLYDNLQAIVNFIGYVKELIASSNDVNKIPVYSEILRKEDIEKEESALKQEIERESPPISISEFDVIGTNEIFNDVDSKYELHFQNEKQEFTDFPDLTQIKKFLDGISSASSTDIPDVKVKFYKEGISKYTKKVYNLIDWCDDKNRALLNNGHWYYYNDEFIEYLDRSLGEITVCSLERYDFKNSEYDAYIKEKLTGEHPIESDNPEKIESVLKEMKKRYYAERYFNEVREKDGFINGDRKLVQVEGTSVEIYDLMKDDTIFAVKLGSASGKLSYAVTQSETSLEWMRKGKIEYPKEINKIGIWFIFDHKLPLNRKIDSYDFSELNMLSLKIRLDAWKKKVRLAGFSPILYINYRY